LSLGSVCHPFIRVRNPQNLGGHHMPGGHESPQCQEKDGDSDIDFDGRDKVP